MCQWLIAGCSYSRNWADRIYIFEHVEDGKDALKRLVQGISSRSLLWRGDYNIGDGNETHLKFLDW